MKKTPKANSKKNSKAKKSSSRPGTPYYFGKLKRIKISSIAVYAAVKVI